MGSRLTEEGLGNTALPQALAGSILVAAEMGDSWINAMPSQMAGENGNGLVAIGTGREDGADVVARAQLICSHDVPGNVEGVHMDECVRQRAQRTRRRAIC